VNLANIGESLSFVVLLPFPEYNKQGLGIVDGAQSHINA
jgi:hypothetical protein